MTPEVLIYPAVRALVAKLAGFAAGVALACALAAAGELILAPLGCVGSALFVGSLSELLMSLFLMVVVWLALWCHMVLLAGRGMEFTRYLLLVGAVLALLMPVCTAYQILVGEFLLLRQDDLPVIVTLLLALSVYLNLPRGVAAGWGKLSAISVFAAAALLYALTNVQALVWVNDVLKIVACGTMWYPLRGLSRYALRVVALPPLGAGA